MFSFQGVCFLRRLFFHVFFFSQECCRLQLFCVLGFGKYSSRLQVGTQLLL